MADSIDRQTAADLLDNLIGMFDDSNGNDYDAALKLGIEALRADVPDTNVGDTISRQAAIADFEWCKSQSTDKNRWQEVIDRISALPSLGDIAVVRCRDCVFGHRHYEVIHGYEDTWIECISPDGMNRDVSINGYCSAGIERHERLN